ncbi:hypothetical protein SDJN03_06310, partial [Cucurbita argyrosperma subsp. sororia]
MALELLLEVVDCLSFAKRSANRNMIVSTVILPSFLYDCVLRCFQLCLFANEIAGKTADCLKMPAKTRRNFALFLAIASAIRGNEEQDKGFEVMPPSFHDISDVEFQDNWGRVWVDLGTSDYFAIDVLLNCWTVLSS